MRASVTVLRACVRARNERGCEMRTSVNEVTGMKVGDAGVRR